VSWLVIVQSLSDMFLYKNGLKQRYALSPLLFRSASECAIRRVQVNQYGLKLNGSQQLLVYADINILSCSVRITQKNIEFLVFVSEVIGLKANVDKLNTW
jgi:hypothetical protein